MGTKLQNGFTPKEGAYDIAIGWLRATFKGSTNDIENYATAPAQVRDLKNQIAKLHNKLLDDSGLDGTYLEYDLPKKKVTP